MRACATQLRGGRTAGSQRDLISELFHALNQPLTGLRCSLELALTGRRVAAEYMNTIESALSLAVQIADTCGKIRQVVEADDPGDAQWLPLAQYVNEVVTDMLPVAEQAGITLSLAPGKVAGSPYVFCEPQRLRQALFYLLEYAIAQPGNAELAVRSLPSPEKTAAIEITILGRAHLPSGRKQDSKLDQRFRMAIALGVFEAAGGSIDLTLHEARVHIRASLPAKHGSSARNGKKYHHAAYSSRSRTVHLQREHPQSTKNS